MTNDIAGLGLGLCLALLLRLSVMVKFFFILISCVWSTVILSGNLSARGGLHIINNEKNAPLYVEYFSNAKSDDSLTRETVRVASGRELYIRWRNPGKCKGRLKRVHLYYSHPFAGYPENEDVVYNVNSINNGAWQAGSVDISHPVFEGDAEEFFMPQVEQAHRGVASYGGYESGLLKVKLSPALGQISIVPETLAGDDSQPLHVTYYNNWGESRSMQVLTSSGTVSLSWRHPGGLKGSLRYINFLYEHNPYPAASGSSEGQSVGYRVTTKNHGNCQSGSIDIKRPFLGSHFNKVSSLVMPVVTLISPVASSAQSPCSLTVHVADADSTKQMIPGSYLEHVNYGASNYDGDRFQACLSGDKQAKQGHYTWIVGLEALRQGLADGTIPSRQVDIIRNDLSPELHGFAILAGQGSNIPSGTYKDSCPMVFYNDSTKNLYAACYTRSKSSSSAEGQAGQKVDDATDGRRGLSNSVVPVCSSGLPTQYVSVVNTLRYPCPGGYVNTAGRLLCTPAAK